MRIRLMGMTAPRVDKEVRCYGVGVRARAFAKERRQVWTRQDQAMDSGRRDRRDGHISWRGLSSDLTRHCAPPTFTQEPLHLHLVLANPHEGPLGYCARPDRLLLVAASAEMVVGGGGVHHWWDGNGDGVGCHRSWRDLESCPSSCICVIVWMEWR